MNMVDAKYEPLAFSDHMAYIVTYTLPALSARIFSPRSRPLFKVRAEVICDNLFQERLSDSMKDWEEMKDLGLQVLQWWELVVKPGIKKLAIQRSKEMDREKRGELNLLLIRQAYLSRKMQLGDLRKLSELRAVQMEIIQQWYQTESDKILIQSRSDEYITMKHMKRSSILKL